MTNLRVHHIKSLMIIDSINNGRNPQYQNFKDYQRACITEGYDVNWLKELKLKALKLIAKGGDVTLLSGEPDLFCKDCNGVGCEYVNPDETIARDLGLTIGKTYDLTDLLEEAFNKYYPNS